VAADAITPAVRARSRVLLGLVDEAAHLALGALVADAVRAQGAWRAELLAGSVALDADHAPSELFGWHGLFPAARTRPFPHCAATPALLAASGRRSAALAVAWHLLRDMSDPTTGVSLLWPLSARPFSWPMPRYHAALGMLAAWR
jgi:hypothetical protein